MRMTSYYVSLDFLGDIYVNVASNVPKNVLYFSLVLICSCL